MGIEIETESGEGEDGYTRGRTGRVRVGFGRTIGTGLGILTLLAALGDDNDKNKPDKPVPSEPVIEGRVPPEMERLIRKTTTYNSILPVDYEGTSIIYTRDFESRMKELLKEVKRDGVDLPQERIAGILADTPVVLCTATDESKDWIKTGTLGGHSTVGFVTYHGDPYVFMPQAVSAWLKGKPGNDSDRLAAIAADVLNLADHPAGVRASVLLAKEEPTTDSLVQDAIKYANGGGASVLPRVAPKIISEDGEEPARLR